MPVGRVKGKALIGNPDQGAYIEDGWVVKVNRLWQCRLCECWGTQSPKLLMAGGSIGGD